MDGTVRKADGQRKDPEVFLTSRTFSEVSQNPLNLNSCSPINEVHEIISGF